MAKENVKRFFEALAKDEKLQSLLREKEVSYAGDREDRETIAREVLIPVAEAGGYPFTVEEMKEVEENLINEGEISDLEAQAVSAGADCASELKPFLMEIVLELPLEATMVAKHDLWKAYVGKTDYDLCVWIS